MFSPQIQINVVLRIFIYQALVSVLTWWAVTEYQEFSMHLWDLSVLIVRVSALCFSILTFYITPIKKFNSKLKKGIGTGNLGQLGSTARALGYWLEGHGFEPKHCEAATFGPLTKAPNPLCSRGTVSCLDPRLWPQLTNKLEYVRKRISQCCNVIVGNKGVFFKVKHYSGIAFVYYDSYIVTSTHPLTHLLI